MQPDPLTEALESVVGGDNDQFGGRLQAAELDAEWPDVESLIKELEMVEGIQSVSKSRFFLSPGLAPTFQVYMAPMFENQYKLLARAGHRVQESATRPALFPKPSDSGVIARLRWTTRALSTTESAETAATTSVFFSKDNLMSRVNSLHKEGKHELALHLFDSMDAKKVEFTPSEFALYIEILAKVKGLGCAFNYFKKADPDFNNLDHHARNWPAYATLARLHWEHLRKAGLRLLTLSCDDESSGSKLHANMKRMDITAPPAPKLTHSTAPIRFGGGKAISVRGAYRLSSRGLCLNNE
ncbi:unnamed protein product [Arabidopsis arenosa]|uniref:Uncharacterized protein n=1 Tax=Arabidopsis arenosa TaxID=38785 RepID=A0A8S1ZL47_ARAAE|nr:unnamed protein product [Arabidopsis arenosa]